MNTQEAKKSILFFIILFSFVLAFLFLTGCMTNRGQFIDDHETVTWTIDGFSSVISIFKSDIHIGRFRPLHVLFRICKKLVFVLIVSLIAAHLWLKFANFCIMCVDLRCFNRLLERKSSISGRLVQL